MLFKIDLLNRFPSFVILLFFIIYEYDSSVNPWFSRNFYRFEIIFVFQCKLYINVILFTLIFKHYSLIISLVHFLNDTCDLYFYLLPRFQEFILFSLSTPCWLAISVLQISAAAFRRKTSNSGFILNYFTTFFYCE